MDSQVAKIKNINFVNSFGYIIKWYARWIVIWFLIVVFQLIQQKPLNSFFPPCSIFIFSLFSFFSLFLSFSFYSSISVRLFPSPAPFFFISSSSSFSIRLIFLSFFPNNSFSWSSSSFSFATSLLLLLQWKLEMHTEIR